MNKKVEMEYKDFMYQKMYGDKDGKQQTAVPDVILSDVHEKLGETYVPYDDFGSPYITNKKEFTSTSTNNERMHITPEKKKAFDTILLNDIYLTQQKYQCDGNTQSERSHSQQNCQYDNPNGNTPNGPSDYETDDENFDDEIQVSSIER